MKTVIIQSFRTFDIPPWIARCLATVQAWAASRGYDYRLTDDSVFALCGDAYLAKVGDNKRSITNLARLELIRLALDEGYDPAIWMDADIQIFAPDRLHFEPARRISFPRETWMWPVDVRDWGVNQTINNCVIICPRGDPDLDLIIQTTRHRGLHHAVDDNQQVGVEVIRGMHRYLDFPVLPQVGMFSHWIVMAIAQGRGRVLDHQATLHGSPIYAANLCASDHLDPPVPLDQAMQAMDVLERTRGEIINARLPDTGAAAG